MTSSLRIVIADDEPDMREYLQRVLPRLGHQVVASASNGAELVSAARASRPDLIITDEKMPVLEGRAALAEIWSESRTPVVLISAYDRPASLGSLEEAGRWAYLNKPFKWTELEAAIQSVVAGLDEAEGGAP